MLQDELLAMSEKLIVTLEDLVARLMPPTSPWNYGRPYKCYDDLPDDDDIITDGSAELCKAFESNNLMRINFDDVEKEKKECGCLNSNNTEKNIMLTNIFVVVCYSYTPRKRKKKRRQD